MKTLATAKPNSKYRWSNNFTDLTLEARLVGGKVIFYEHANGREHAIAADIVKQLFPIDCRIVERPFLVGDNKEFYAVLYKNRKGHKDVFNEIAQPEPVPRIRTRNTNPKRTRNGSKESNPTVQNQGRIRRKK